jgi:hypothetical protein
MERSIKTLDIQYNDTHHNATHHNDTQHYITCLLLSVGRLRIQAGPNFIPF